MINIPTGKVSVYPMGSPRVEAIWDGQYLTPLAWPASNHAILSWHAGGAHYTQPVKLIPAKDGMLELKRMGPVMESQHADRDQRWPLYVKAKLDGNDITIVEGGIGGLVIRSSRTLRKGQEYELNLDGESTTLLCLGIKGTMTGWSVQYRMQYLQDPHPALERPAETAEQ